MNLMGMRISRSCSPTHKTCISTCTPDCCKPCCIPRRRCQSLSPRRHRRRFYERLSCSPSESDLCISYDSCLPRSRNCMPRICSPCQPRRCSFKNNDLCGSKTCYPLSYYPCSPPYSYKRDTCFPSTCEPCVTRRDYYIPRACVLASPCYPRSCRPYSRPMWNSRTSYSPCLSLKCDPCYPLKCDPCYPLKCDPCYTSRRRLSPDCYVPHACSPLYSPLRGACMPCNPNMSRRRFCSPCDDASEALANIKFRGLRCDNFSKVCYPKDLPLKSCTAENFKRDACNCNCVIFKEPMCEVAKVDTVRTMIDEGPSRNFLQKSRQVGACLGRYEPHFCPWEADVSMSGTVRGHCTSTAVEVARRMTGRFRAEGDRFTKDSRESIIPCPKEGQKMCLGRLDDGTSLNFKRNMSRNDNKSQESAPDPTNLAEDSFKTKKNRRSDNHSENHNSCFSSACEEIPDLSSEHKKRSPGVSSREQKLCGDGLKGNRFIDDGIKEQKPYCSRRASNHNVRFGSNNETSSFKSISVTKDLPQFSRDVGTPYSEVEVETFLNSRKDRRRRNRDMSPPRNISGNVNRISPANQGSDCGEYKSPSSFSFRHNRTLAISECDSPLFTPPTHSSSHGDNRFSSSASRDNMANPSKYKEYPPKKMESTEYHEVSLDGDPNVALRRKSYRQKRPVDGLLENKRRR